MSSRRALGRGLGALLPPDEPDSFTNQETFATRAGARSPGAPFITEVPVASVVPNPLQPRLDFDETSLDELAESIRQLGIIQPITVRRIDGGFELITGERRLRAAQRIGLQRVPAFVREADTEAMLEMALVENVQREALNPIEIALGFRRLMEECSLTQEQVAVKVGKNRATVANQLRLLRLAPRIQAAIRDGVISAGHARSLLSVDDEGLRESLVDAIIDGELSVREAERRARAIQRGIQRVRGGGRSTSGNVASVQSQRDFLFLRQYEDRLRSHLATQIQIRHRSNEEGGKVEISYYSADDLDRLLEMLLR